MRRSERAGAVAGLLAALLSPSAHAHGFGQRFDLPLPLTLWVWSAGGTIVFTFIVAALFVREAPPAAAHPRLPVASIDLTGRSLGRVSVSAVRIFSAALLLLALAAGLIGAQDPFHNLAPTVIWVIWWVGVTYCCALIGNLWRLANPFAVIFAGARRLYAACTGRLLGFDLPYPRKLGTWPAVAIFLAFTWAELLWTEKDVPSALARVALGYCVATWVGMLVWGGRWLEHGEAFSVMFDLMGRFAPLEGRLEGALRTRLAIFLRPPGQGLLESAAVTVSFVVFVTTLLSSVTFDGFLDTPLYQNLLTAIYTSPRLEIPLSHISEWSGLEEGVLIGTGMLACATVIFSAALFLTSLAMRMTAEWGAAAAASKGAPAGSKPPVYSARDLACRFVLSLVPIAIAYHLAHYLSLLLTAGQFIIPLSSDPLGWGWNLLGSAAYHVDIGIVGPRFFWYASVSAILVGHIVSVYLSHIVAIRLFGNRRTAFLSQLPMILLMVCYTMSSLWILAQPVVG